MAHIRGSRFLLYIFLLTTGCRSADKPDVDFTFPLLDSTTLMKDLQYLSSDSLQGRLVGTEGNRKARDYILKRFKDAGIDSFPDGYLRNFLLSKDGDSIECVNVVGYIRGKKTPGKYIVVTAHYDHIGVVDGNIYNGADDNASGTASLFALGLHFKKNPPDHSILFVAFDAEEQGLVGAEEFLRNAPVPIGDIVMNVNIDMVGRDKEHELYAVGISHYPFLKPYLDTVVHQTELRLKYGYDGPTSAEDWTTMSDHYPFHLRHIPFIYFGVENFENHHRSTDKFNTIMPEFYIEAVETIIRALEIFDRNLKEIQIKSEI